MTKNVMPAILALIVLLAPFAASNANAEIMVRFETPLGDIDVELFDQDAPLTVANFLNYVNDGDYVNTFFHRSVPGFVIQGGGFALQPDGQFPIDAIPTAPPCLQ